jgi:hypothetical protein
MMTTRSPGVQLREIEVSEMLGTMRRSVADRYPDAIVDDAFVDNVLDASGRDEFGPDENGAFTEFHRKLVVIE